MERGGGQHSGNVGENIQADGSGGTKSAPVRRIRKREAEGGRRRAEKGKHWGGRKIATLDNYLQGQKWAEMERERKYHVG